MATQRYLVKFLEELGLRSIYNSPIDTKFLCIQRFVRLFAYGGSTLILVLYLSALGISDTKIGLFMTLTLVGDVLISFCLTLVADAIGRKTILAAGAALMSGSGVVFGTSGNYWVLLAAAIFGVISPRYGPIPKASFAIAIATKQRVVEMKLVLSEQSRNQHWPISRLLRSAAISLPGIP